MGEFIGNVFVRTEDASAVVAAAKEILGARVGPGRPAGAREAVAGPISHLAALASFQPVAYVSPGIEGWVGVFDRYTEGDDDPAWTVMEYSRRLNTQALSFRSDDGDYLHYVLAEQGEIIDRYHSAPHLIGLPLSRADLKALRGDPETLCRAAGLPQERCPEVRSELKRVSAGERGALEALIELGRLLGIPNASCTWRSMDQVALGLEEARAWVSFTALKVEDLPRPDPARPLVVPDGSFVVPKEVVPRSKNLPVEVVLRPAPHDSTYAVWVVYYPAEGSRWREQILRSVASDLSEVQGPMECVVWIDEIADGGPFRRASLRLFFAFGGSPEEERADLLERVAGAPFPATRATLSRSALPILKRAMDGSVIRLWGSPHPNVPLRQKMTVDWCTFFLLNRGLKVQD